MRLFLFVCLCIVPTTSCAAVTFSEIAWMGNTASANDEWIELYNDGSAIDVTNWRISDGMNFDVVLTGSIAAGQYAVLERTDDTSAAGSAFLIYTGALTNAGATLTLYDANGAVVDQLSGGEDWENIGGDNVTKETAQYTSGGWVTAVATPGQANAAASTKDDEEENNETTDTENTNKSDVKKTTKTTDDSPTKLFLIPRELSVQVTIPKEIYVNQAVTFTAKPSGLSKGILQSLQYEWNFGDFTTSTEVSPVHHYTHPGNYVVTLYVQYKTYTAEFRQSVTVLPITMSLSTLPNGDIQVHNNARYEVDVSGYQLGELVFPPRSILVAGGTVTVSAKKVGHTHIARTLYDNTKKVVVRAGETTSLDQEVEKNPLVAQANTAPILVAQAYTAPADVSTEDTNFSFAPADTELPNSVTEAVAGAATSVAPASATAPITPAPSPASDNRMYYGLLALIGLGLFGVYVRQ